MTKIRQAMLDAGHRVDADSAIGSTSLRTSVFVMGEPSATPTMAELEQLHAFLQDGGMILLFADTGIDLPTYNHLLAGLGSTIQFTTTTISTTSALTDSPFTQGPVKISGSVLNVTSGNGTTGGTSIDNNYVRYEQVGGGYVVAFGDRIDHNDVISATNTQLLLNVVSVAVGPATPIPALSPASIALLSLLLAAFAAMARARSTAFARKP